MRLFRTAILFTALLSLTTTTLYAQDNTLEKVKEAGTIIVGVKTDYPPWGMRDADGNIVGMEIDMAQDIADRLGVELELVPVVASNRMQFLEQGKIDLMLATMSDTEERREIVGIVQPNYYASGINVMAPKSLGLKEWTELEGKPVCGVQGAWYNKKVAETYGAEPITFKGVPEVEQALMAGRCAAWLYDDSAFVTRLRDTEKWGDYEMPLETTDFVPWGIAVPLAEREGPYGQAIGEIIADWHKQGTLVELEAKWDIPPTAWLAEQHQAAASD